MAHPVDGLHLRDLAPLHWEFDILIWSWDIEPELSCTLSQENLKPSDKLLEHSFRRYDH